MPTPDGETLGALNALLEDERAGVEIEVALASDVTEFVERDALTTMGVEDTAACCALREHLDALGGPVSHRINGIVFTILRLERYDDRLRAFAEHQRGVMEGISSLLERADGLNRELRSLLEEILTSHGRHVVWCLQRAEEFALSRQIERLGGPAMVFGSVPHPSDPLTAPAAPEPGIEGLEPEPYQPPNPPDATPDADTPAREQEATAADTDPPDTSPDTTEE